VVSGGFWWSPCEFHPILLPERKCRSASSPPFSKYNTYGLALVWANGSIFPCLPQPTGVLNPVCEDVTHESGVTDRSTHRGDAGKERDLKTDVGRFAERRNRSGCPPTQDARTLTIRVSLYYAIGAAGTAANSRRKLPLRFTYDLGTLQI